MGSTLAKESASATHSSSAALQFLNRITELVKTQPLVDEDYEVIRQFCGKCIVSAAKQNQFLFGKESKENNLAVCAAAFNTLIDVVTTLDTFIKAPPFYEFIRNIYQAISAQNSLLGTNKNVVDNARKFVRILIDKIDSGADQSSFSLKEIRTLSLQLLDDSASPLDFRKEGNVDPEAIISIKGRYSGFKIDKTYLMKSIHNIYLAADVKWAVRMHGGEYTPSDAWTVHIVPNNPGVVVLQSNYGTYLTASPDGRVSCARVDKPRDNEFWWPSRTDDGFILLKNKDQLYLCTDTSETVYLSPKCGGDELLAYWGVVPCPQSVVMGAHQWEVITIETPQWCDYCGSFIWGLGVNAHKCKKCGLCVHGACKAGIGDNCKQSVELFGHRDEPKEKPVDPEELAKQQEQRRVLASFVCAGPAKTEEEAEQEALEQELLFQQLRTTARLQKELSSMVISPLEGELETSDIVDGNEQGSDEEKVETPIVVAEVEIADVPDEEKIEAPAEEKKVEAPAEEKKVEAPAEEKKDEGKVEDSAEEKKDEAKVEAPAEEKKVEAKAEAPAEEKKVEAKVEAPAEEKNVEAPAEEKNVEAPAEEKNVEAPAEEKKVEAPAEEKKVDVPAAQKPPQKKLPTPAPQKTPTPVQKKVQFPPAENKVEPPAEKKVGTPVKKRAAVLDRFNPEMQKKEEPVKPAAAPRRKLANNPMRAQLEGMMKKGGGIGMPMMGGPRPRGAPSAASEDVDPAFVPPPKNPQPEVEFTGELGIPVSKEPRLNHVKRNAGPRRRRPAAASTP